MRSDPTGRALQLLSLLEPAALADAVSHIADHLSAQLSTPSWEGK